METEISYSEVENSCNELHELAKNMKETLNNIINTGNSLKTNESWQGSASDYFNDKLNQLIKNFDEAFIEIENSILFMASCSEGYQAIDSKIMGEICSNLNITEPNLSTSGIFGTPNSTPDDSGSQE